MARLGRCDAPQELIDDIIDQCAEDQRTLIACSLTSRAWVGRTRKHLFSQLTLNDKTLPVWCGNDVTPTTSSYPPVSSSPLSYRLSPYVISLHLLPKHYLTSPDVFSIKKLLLAKSHLSAFINLKSLALTCVPPLEFDDTSLKACFGFLAETVSKLRLSACQLDEKRLFAILRLFTRLESLEFMRITWDHSGYTFEKDPPTSRGSFIMSQCFGEGSSGNQGLLVSLATTKAEYHTISLGWNPPSTAPGFNALFARCKDHLKTLSLTAPEWGSSSTVGLLDLSPCDKLAAIQAWFADGEFEKIFPVLKTIGSPRFRKLTFFIMPSLPKLKKGAWRTLDEEVIALAKRVNAMAAVDRLELLFSSYSPVLGGVESSAVRAVLPRIASDARVSLGVEN